MPSSEPRLTTRIMCRGTVYWAMTWRRVGLVTVVVLVAAMGVRAVGFDVPWADGGDGPADAPEQESGSPNATGGDGADDAGDTPSPTPADGTPTQSPMPTATATSSSNSGDSGGGGGSGGGSADDGSDETAISTGSTTVSPGPSSRTPTSGRVGRPREPAPRRLAGPPDLAGPVRGDSRTLTRPTCGSSTTMEHPC